MSFSIPSAAKNPVDAPELLWALQTVLLAEAEARFGARDASKQIFQPVFREDGPIIINTPNLDGAFAALSDNAKGYWPTAVYELAHETVHLLNPVPGHVNVLEEGVAHLFSLEMVEKYGGGARMPEVGAYAEAARLVQQLAPAYTDAIKQMREGEKPLSAVTPSDITRHCPVVPTQLAQQLAAPCKPR